MSIATSRQSAKDAPVIKMRCKSCKREWSVTACYDADSGWYLADEAFECPGCQRGWGVEL